MYLISISICLGIYIYDMPSFTLQSPTWNGSELNQVNPPYCSWYLWYAQRTEKRETHIGSIKWLALE